MNLISFGLNLLLYPTAIINLDSKMIPRDTNKVNVLVHGFLHNRSSWIYLQRALRKHSELGPVFTLNLGHPFQSIDSYAQKLQKKIQAIQAEAGRSSLDVNLIGHSMGGLVCLQYALKYAQKDGVGIPKVITLASPLQGTPTANLAQFWSHSGRQMLPGSDFLRDLQEQVAALKGQTSIYHLGCGRDLVVPSRCTFFEGGCNDREFPTLSHFSLLYSPEVADQVVNWLKS